MIRKILIYLIILEKRKMKEIYEEDNKDYINENNEE